MRQKIASFVLAWAGLTPAWAQVQDILAVGTEFSFIFEKSTAGQYHGYAVDLLTKLAQKSGHTLRFEILPWSRAQWMVEQGQAQILIGPYKSAQRQDKFEYAQRALFRDQIVFYVRKDSGMGWNGDYRRLQNSRVAVIQGWVYGDAFEQARALIKPAIASNLSSAINLLETRRVDYLASNKRDTEGWLRQSGQKQILSLEPAIDLQDAYLAYCKQKVCSELRQQFDQIYQQMWHKQEIQKIAKAYPINLPD